MVTGYEAKGRSVAFSLESFSWRWVIYKPSECIDQIPKVPRWKREATLCSIELSDKDLQQCNEFTKQYQRDYLECKITSQVVYRSIMDNVLTIPATVRIKKYPIGVRLHLPSEMLVFMSLMDMNQVFVRYQKTPSLIACNNLGALTLYWKD